jgi:hypothetical protein
MLQQYDYTIEYRSTTQHGNADVLSRLPIGSDEQFDKEEEDDDVDTVCAIGMVDSHLKATDPGALSKASAKDKMISQAMRFTQEGWPHNIDEDAAELHLL